MGTDIHLYVEHRVDGAWASADKWTLNEYADEPGALVVDWNNRFYHERNYDLFAMLAGVRNGRGFGGCDTGDGFIPISEARGLPYDLSPQLHACVDEGTVDHTPSWLTVADLMAYDWTQKTKKRGWVGIGEWAQWRDYGKPESYSGSIAGSNVKHVTPEDMEKGWQELRTKRGYPESRYASTHLHPDGSSRNEDFVEMTMLVAGRGHEPFCQVQWGVSYYQEAVNFLGTVLPRLWKLGAPNDVRIVFWFDS